MIHKKYILLFLILAITNHLYVMDKYSLLRRDINSLSDIEKKEYLNQREEYMLSLDYLRHYTYNQTALEQSGKPSTQAPKNKEKYTLSNKERENK